MKKRILFTVVIMLLGVTTMTAQSFTGKWELEKEFFELTETESDGLKLYITLNIDKKNMNVDLLLTSEKDEDGDEISFILSYPSTYTKKGNKVTAAFDYDKAGFKIVDYKTEDPEIANLISTKEGKDTFFALLNSQLQSQRDELLPEMYDAVKTLFSDFTIKDLKAKKLTILSQDEVELNFLR